MLERNFNIIRLYHNHGISPMIRRIDFENLIVQSRRLITRHIEESEDDAALSLEMDSNNNPNFIKEKDINFRQYPFYINWKKLESNEKSYFRSFSRFGYLGASIYSTLKQNYQNLTINNILYFLCSIIPNYLFKNDEYFIEKFPNLDDLCELVRNKSILFKEVPIVLAVLKVYEVYYIIKKNIENLENVAKAEFLLVKNLTEQEFNDIYKAHFKQKIHYLFKKIAKNKGKEYEFPKTKKKFFSHIQSIYKKYIKNKNNK